MEKVEEYYVVFVEGKGYFSNVYESYETDEEGNDLPNYDFHEEVKNAYKFRSLQSMSPKYLLPYNPERDKETVHDAAKFLGGKVLKYRKRTVITHELLEVVSDEE